MKYSFVRNALVYLVGTVVVKGVTILLLPILTHNLDPAEYGVLELLNRATDVLCLCLFLNGNCLAVITCYNQTQSEDRRQQIAGSALVFGALCVLAVGGLAEAFAGPITALLGVNSIELVRLAFLGALCDAFVAVCLALTQARVESVTFTAVTAAQVSLRVCLIAVFVCILHWGVRGVLVASILASGMFAFGLLAREIRRSGLHVETTVLRDLFWFALPFLPGGLCAFMINSGDQFLLVRYASTWDVGLYVARLQAGPDGRRL